MRTLIVSNTSFFGGGETFVESVLSQLKDVCFIVRSYTLYERLDQTKTIVFKSDNRAEQLCEIKEAVKTFNADTVILNGGSTIYFAPFLRNIKVVIFRHSTNRAAGGIFKQIIYSTILHCCYAFATKIIHVSDFSRREQKLFTKRAITIHNGVMDTHPERYRISERRLRLLYLGRVDESKGIKELVKAVKQFSDDQIHLSIVGDGDLRPYLEELKAKNITYYGFSSDPSQYYNTNDVFISLPTHEAFGLTFIEAMNYSMPIIATAVGGIPEIVIDGENGFLISKPEEAVTAIRKLLDNNDLRQQMGAKSRDIFTRNFTVETTVKKINTVINSL